MSSSLMGTEEIGLCLQTRGTLELFALNTHCLTLIFQMHALHLLLSSEIKVLLPPHGIDIEAGFACRVSFSRSAVTASGSRIL